jgi:uncharacterized phage protein (TIGR01671 family)
MREIKFRAWDKKDKIMRGQDGWLDIAVGKGFCGIQTEDNPHEFVSKHCYDLIPMQYTGLKDKNGKEIYEGDIMTTDCDCEYACLGHQAKVVYDEQHAYFSIAGNMLGEGVELEVIGNIYENPELVKESE